MIHKFFELGELTEPATQVCHTCGEEKLLHYFSRGFAGEKSRLRSECQECNWTNRQFLKALRKTLKEPAEGDPCQRPGCGRTDKKLTLDHCHETGKPRGWLCPSCNLSIGQLGDTIKDMYGVIEYLKQAEQGRNIEYLKPNPMAEEFFVKVAAR